MTNITFFPASATRDDNPLVVTQSAVFATDETRTFDDKLGGYHSQFRLNIDPWDVKRIVAEANRMGREGINVVGFGYDRNRQAIVLGPKESHATPSPHPSPLRPGQLHPNELETAILQKLAAHNPSLPLHIPALHVLSRKYTGVGSFTDFLTSHSTQAPPTPDTRPRTTAATLDVVQLPTLKHGLGYAAFFLDNQLETLELYTFGDEKWDGTFTDFSLP